MKRLRAFSIITMQVASPVILCGDFNVAPGGSRHSQPAALAGTNNVVAQAERSALDEIKRWGFTDTFSTAS